ncbi:MAG: PHP domain-containing protein [Thermoproteota archaeon]|nr:PHP domain-containing protein [Thermoproteota archaeon]
MLNLKEDYHVHTNFNDHSPSNLSVANIIKCGEEKGLISIAFTEHVRKSSTWIPKYLKEIDKAKSSRTAISMISGFEAKILDSDTLDFPEEYAGHFLVASFHTRYGSKDKWFHALKLAIKSSHPNALGHLAPEESFDLNSDELNELSDLLIKFNITAELNAKYRRPPLHWLRVFKEKNVNFHLASDAHRLQDVGNFDSIMNLISFVGREN